MAAMRLPPKVKFFRANPGLKGLPPADVHRFVQDVTERQLARGEAIWHPADPADSVFFIETGVVRVARPGSRGRSSPPAMSGSNAQRVCTSALRVARESHRPVDDPSDIHDL